MDTSVDVTASVFDAYLKCPTKAYLTARKENSPDTFFADVRGRISAAYKAMARQNLRTGSTSAVQIDFAQLASLPALCGATVYVDSGTASYACEPPASARGGRRAKGAELTRDYLPVVYWAWDKNDQTNDLIVVFGALALAQATGTKVPPIGKVIYGEGLRSKTVRIADHLPKTRQVIREIASICHASNPPPLILNKHCPTCDFRLRCRHLPVEADDLSLLGAMTEKERVKYRDKGISSITQLSYGYRPRRRRRIKATTSRGNPPVKHDHRLKALAIKKAQIHVVGSPSLSIDGTPVFMDVEGVPDRDFYYLVGLRYETHGTHVERSFWANGPEGEQDAWRECLCVLKEIDNPRIVHYGAYESRFLKLMKERWKLVADDNEFVDRIVNGSLNLLAVIYGKIYFPTYSNGLKEIARWLGFEWTWPSASGSGAMLLRRSWELTSDDGLRRELTRYNIEDCRATALLTDALVHVCGKSESGFGTKLDTVDVGSLEVAFQRTFGKFPSALPEFEKINGAAYWDYQRSKVYVRTNKAIRRSVEKTMKPIQKLAVDKEVMVEDKPTCCPRCGASRVRAHQRKSRIIFDLRFTRRGIKRWTVKYWYHNYRCGACKADFTLFPRAPKYGQNFRAYAVYLLIEMRLSNQKIAEHIGTVFNVPITKSMVLDIKSELAKKYEPTYRSVIQQIACGPLAHADETKGVVYGGGHYVWVFANLVSVAYVYSPSREASILDEVLAGFDGVLVSDFYGGYDSVPCRQQKCLIHLMRDVNDDVLKHPFNEELTFIAKRFGTLLREIVDTIDRYGLRKRHLGKHKQSVARFLGDVAALKCNNCSSPV
jgi:predicted RecB family nuclease